LPAASQDEISRICLPVQFREGATAYRNCVQTEIDIRTGNADSGMVNLSFDDKYAVQQTCAAAGGKSSEQYKTCVNDQIAALNQITAPDLSGIAEDEQYAIQQTCFTAQSKEGAASYRQCLNRELQSLNEIPVADTSSLNTLDKNALQLRCSANASTAADYRRCIGAEFESFAGVQPTFLPVSTATRVAPAKAVQPANTVVGDVVEKVAQQTANQPVVSKVKEEPIKIEPLAQNSVNTGSTTTGATAKLPRSIAPQRAESTAIVKPLEVKSSEAIVVSQASTSTLRDATTDSTVETTTVNSQSTTVAINSAERVISKPELVDALEEQARAKAQGIEPAKQSNGGTAEIADNATQTDPMQTLSALWNTAKDKLTSLDRFGWIVIAAILAFPAFLMGLFSLIKKSKARAVAYSSNVNTTSLAERIEPGIRTRRERHERDAASLFDDEVPADLDQTSNNHQAISENPAAEADSHEARHDSPAPVTPMDTEQNDQATRFAAKPVMHATCIWCLVS